MTNIFDRFFNRPPQKTAKTAKERLQFVLVTDRSQLSPEELRQMQAEILDVIRKYCRIDEEAVDMKLEARERSNYLVADIPLRKTNPHSDEEPGRIAFMMQTNETTDLDGDDAKSNHSTENTNTTPSAAALDTDTAESAPDSGTAATTTKSTNTDQETKDTTGTATETKL